MVCCLFTKCPWQTEKGSCLTTNEFTNKQLITSLILWLEFWMMSWPILSWSNETMSTKKSGIPNSLKKTLKTWRENLSCRMTTKTGSMSSNLKTSPRKNNSKLTDSLSNSKRLNDKRNNFNPTFKQTLSTLRKKTKKWWRTSKVFTRRNLLWKTKSILNFKNSLKKNKGKSKTKLRLWEKSRPQRSNYSRNNLLTASKRQKKFMSLSSNLWSWVKKPSPKKSIKSNKNIRTNWRR